MQLKSYICFAIALIVLAACGSEPAPGGEEENPSASASDPLTGTWVGDWGPSAQDRNPVTVQLNWDGSSLTGTVNPGPNAIELIATSFDPQTGAIRMEADAEGFRGPVHYVIEGEVEGNTMSGTWNHDNSEGDFRITRD